MLEVFDRTYLITAHTACYLTIPIRLVSCNQFKKMWSVINLKLVKELNQVIGKDLNTNILNLTSVLREFQSYTAFEPSSRL